MRTVTIKFQIEVSEGYTDLLAHKSVISGVELNKTKIIDVITDAATDVCMSINKSITLEKQSSGKLLEAKIE